MDAKPLLFRIAQALDGVKLEAVMIENSAAALHGIRSFESIRSDAVEVRFGNYTLYIADLMKNIQSKKALGRKRDLAVIDILEKTFEEKER